MSKIEIYLIMEQIQLADSDTDFSNADFNNHKQNQKKQLLLNLFMKLCIAYHSPSTFFLNLILTRKTVINFVTTILLNSLSSFPFDLT